MPSVRGPLAVALALAAAAAPAGLAGISRERIPFPYGFDLATGSSSAPSIATTPDGAPHILYPQAGQILHHAWRRGGTWRDEVVDPRYAWSEAQSIAVDGLGRVHVAYSAYDEPYSGEAVVMHAVRDDSGWSLTEIAPGRLAVLYLGPDDRPRIVFEGPDRMEVATFDGLGWGVGEFGPAPPDSIRPLALLPDSEGHLHALADRGGGWGGDYATDATGTWVRTTEWGVSLALDRQGHPHLATGAATGIEGARDRLVHRWFDGAVWQGEDVLEWGVAPRLRDAPRIGLDAAGRPFLVYYQLEEFPDGATATIRLAYHDGSGWRDLRVGRPGPAFPLPPAVAGDGSIHAIWIGAWARVALPDLQADAEQVRSESVEDGARLAGALRVRNLGAGRSRATRARFYLSDDDLFDEGDEPIAGSLGVPALPPGGKARIPLALHVPGPVAGKRLLMVLDPARRLHDIDRPNNTAAIPLGE